MSAIEILGIAETVENMDRAAGAVHDGTGRGVERLADHCLDEMRRNVPVRSGRGYRSLMVDYDARNLDARIGPEHGGHDDPEVYLRFVEFGWEQPAQPFMRPALESTRRKAPEVVDWEVKQRLRRLTGGK